MAARRRGEAWRPIRSCAGCGRRAAQSELRRFAAPDGTLVPDPSRRLPGRGAWVHPRRDCYELAVRRRGFQRALRAPVTIPPDLVDW